MSFDSMQGNLHTPATPSDARVSICKSLYTPDTLKIKGLALRHLFLIALGVFIAITMFQPVVVAEDPIPPFYSFVYYPDGTYTVGSQITVFGVYVSGDEYVDVEGPYLEFGETDRVVPLERSGIGIYEAVVTISEEDIANDMVHLWAYHESRVDGENSTLFGVISIDRPEVRSKHLDVVLLDPADAHPQPGRAVEFQVRSYNETGPVDPYPDTLEVVAQEWPEWVERRTGEDRVEHPLEVIRVDEGVFQGTFTVPAGLNTSTRYILKADAVILDWDEDYRHETRNAHVMVNLLNVHIQTIERNMMSSSLRFYITDLAGAPVKGANVSFSTGYYDPYWGWYQSCSDITGPMGTVDFELDYPDLYRYDPYIFLLGEVRVGDVVHSIEESILASEHGGLVYLPPQGSTEGIRFHSDYWNLQRDTHVESNMTIFHDGAPAPNAPVFFLGRYTKESYFVGSAVTDENGTFLLSFDTSTEYRPERYIQFDFFIYVDGIWHREFLFNPIDLGTPFNRWIGDAAGTSSVTATPSDVTEELDVIIRSAEADGEQENAWVLWGLGSPFDPDTSTTAEWRMTGHTWAYAFGAVECLWYDGEYRATVRVPEFLPGGLDVWVVGLIEFHDRPGVPIHSGLVDTLTILRNNPPEVLVDGPDELHNVTGPLWINGTASDDDNIIEVQISIDGGEWQAVDGTSEWNYLLDTDALTEGNHTIRVRAYNGEHYSTPDELVITVLRSTDVGSNGGDGDGPGTWVIVVAIALVLLLVPTSVIMFRIGRHKVG